MAGVGRRWLEGEGDGWIGKEMAEGVMRWLKGEGDGWKEKGDG